MTTAAGINTLCFGFSIIFKRDITRKDIVNIVDELHTEFGDGWKFTCESACEGGIDILEWPGKQQYRGYKCLRFHEPASRATEHSRQRRSEISEWRDAWKDDETVIFTRHPIPRRNVSIKHTPKRLQERTFLKSLDDAPKWTRGELLKFAFVFSNHGMIIKNKTALRNRR